MYLSLENRAIVAALIKEGKKEEANKIINEWHSSKSAEPITVYAGQPKIDDINEHIKRNSK